MTHTGKSNCDNFSFHNLFIRTVVERKTKADART